MKIALDCTVAGRQGGVSVYALQLIAALGRAQLADELILWCGAPEAAGAVQSQLPARGRVVRAGLSPLVWQWTRIGRLNPFSIESLVGAVDIFHGLNYLLPAQRGRVRRIMTLHDLSTLHHPEWHPRRRAVLHRLALRRTARAVDHVITPTEAIRAEVLGELGLPEERVTAIHHGVSGVFRPRPSTELKRILDPLGLVPGQYLCYVGVIEPRKNLSRLLDAFARLRAADPTTPPLVIAGAPGWRNTEVLHRLTAPGVRYLGYLSLDEAAALVTGSAVFVYPSLYEGFGLPVLEAMASGVPVVTSRGGALIEVAGDAAVLVDPTDVDAIVAGIRRALDDTDLRLRLATRGPERAAAFSWDRAAAETLGVYARIANAG